jgi:hypothetical protein
LSAAARTIAATRSSGSNAATAMSVPAACIEIVKAFMALHPNDAAALQDADDAAWR